jgi:hypothetical protein
VFKAGAGTITYAARNQLAALRAEPGCAEVITGTAEVSNSYYTTMQAGATGSVVQDFGVRAGEVRNQARWQGSATDLEPLPISRKGANDGRAADRWT